MYCTLYWRPAIIATTAAAIDDGRLAHERTPSFHPHGLIKIKYSSRLFSYYYYEPHELLSPSHLRLRFFFGWFAMSMSRCRYFYFYRNGWNFWAKMLRLNRQMCAATTNRMASLLNTNKLRYIASYRFINWSMRLIRLCCQCVVWYHIYALSRCISLGDYYCRKVMHQIIPDDVHVHARQIAHTSYMRGSIFCSGRD